MSAETPRSRATLPTLFSVVILDLVGFGIVMPVLPFYAREFGLDAVGLGLLFTGYAAMQFVFAPIWGRLSDRFGRRPVLLGTISGTALSLLALALAPSLLALFAARLLAGAFAANVSVATAYVGDVTAADERTRWMGMIGASFAVGFTLGPGIGAALASFGTSVPIFGAAALAIVNLGFALVSLPEPVRHREQETAGGPASRLEVLRDPRMLRLCGAYFLFTVGVTQLEVVFAWFMQDRFGWDITRFGLLLVAMAIVMGGVQGGGIKPLVARFGERRLVVAGSLLLAAAFLVLPFVGGIGALVAVLAVAAIGRGITQPPLMGLASVAAGDQGQGIVMGTFQSSASLARVVGPLAAGLYEISPVGPFHLAGGLLILVALLGRGLPEQAPAADAARAAVGPS